MVLQNFVLALSEFLSFYQSQCNSLLSQVAERRSHEERLLNFLGEAVTHEITVMELSVHMGSLVKQVRLLAAICLHSKFNAQLVFSEPIAYTKKSFLENFRVDIESLQGRSWKEEFPKGAGLLTYLYKVLLCCDSFSDQ